MQSFSLLKGDRTKQLARIAAFLAALSPERIWAVEVKEVHRRRSDAQNNYLNGVAYRLISEHTGYERDEVSEYLCGTYWGWKPKKVPKKPSNPDGVESVPIRTTTTNESGGRAVLTVTEFSDYVAFVQRFAAGKGVFIPDPE